MSPAPVPVPTWIVLVPRDLLEAVVEGQVVPDGVLPARLALLVEGEVLGHVLVDLAERQLLLLGVLDGHGDERRVGVGGSHQLQQLLLTRDGQPAQVRSREARGARQERPLGAVGGRDEGGVVPVQVGGGGVQPEVGVGVGGGGEVSQGPGLVVHGGVAVTVQRHLVLGAFPRDGGGWRRGVGGLRAHGVHYPARYPL